MRPPHSRQHVQEKKSGWAGIRTQGTLSRTAVFKTAAFVHSATHPYFRDQNCGDWVENSPFLLVTRRHFSRSCRFGKPLLR